MVKSKDLNSPNLVKINYFFITINSNNFDLNSYYHSFNKSIFINNLYLLKETIKVN